MLATETRTAIREATAADLPACVAMLVRFNQESEYRTWFTVDPVYALKAMTWLLANGTIFLLEKDGQSVGMFGVGMVPHMYTGRLYASELFWWVAPEYRDGIGGLRLLRAGEQWAREHGAESIHMIAPNGRIGALYSRLGYTKVEEAYQKGLRP